MAVIVQERNVAGADLIGRLTRGIIGGVVVGALFIGVTMWFADSTGGEAKGPLMMISTIVLGENAMADGTASAGVGAAVHFALSALFGVIFALVVPAFRTNGTLLIAGTVYGGLLYVVNFLIFARTLFPVLKMANQPFEVVVHIAFGTLLAMAFLSGDSRRGEPVLALESAARS
ncbi:MAG TPA: hypothetical protein VFA34_01595 [Actinomycetota bacterium]|jgi:uncharacterized membrane protein YagU involved in acid resistance|nr:hypothetical protein [Actinomycetota bacterium]